MTHEFNPPASRTLELILESLPLFTWHADLALAVTYARGGTVLGLGLDRLFHAGVSLRDVLPNDHPLVAAHVAALRGDAREIDFEWMERSYQTRIVPLRNDAGIIIGAAGLAHDVTELKRAERTIVWQSSFDQLTGTLNRSRFTERLDMLLLQAKRVGSQVTIVLVDVDDFTPVNSLLGHTTGDEVLRAFARRVAAAVPEDAVIGRVDGDELAIVLPGTTADEVRVVCDDVHTRFERPFAAGGKELQLSVSIGTAAYPFDGDSAERLLRCAKAATRRAHQLGGRRSQVFFPALTIDSIQQMELDQSLRRALDREEFFLVYQPQIRLIDGALEGLEVLLRWKKDGDVLPAWSFIPRLEQSPLMVPVGHWILDTALSQYKAWRDRGLDPGRLAVNVGARQLSDEFFVSNVRRSLCLHGIAPELLDVEITETAAMQNVEASVHIVEELRDLGAEISIDDFGTGYSSLNYLKHFTITGLKIDRSFVADLPDSRTGAAIVDSMISTAKALDLRLIAEGVENEPQAAWLRQAGCASAQGFLFAKPMPAADVVQYLGTHGGRP